MSLAKLSIKRPAFITSVIILLMALGVGSFLRLGVDLFPNVTFPIVMVTVPYPGAGPQEMETQVSKVLEEQFSTISGIKTVSSVSKEGVSVVSAEFSLETDVKYAEQQVRDKLSTAKRKLPDDIEEPLIRRIDPADQPVLSISIESEMQGSELYDFANEVVRPRIEQVNQVGLVEIYGGSKREIHVLLDQKALERKEISAQQIAGRIAAAGQNVPAGKVSDIKQETIYRTLGEFKNLKQIEGTIVSLTGNDVPVTVGELARVVDSTAEEKSRVYYNSNKSLFISVYRQSGANTIAVVDNVQKRIDQINKSFEGKSPKVELKVVRDGAKPIRLNVFDVQETIVIGMVLTILVVFFFLGSLRSTIITGLALPTSLLGAFILMAAFGFTINIMTLLALSLAIGLLIDDAIVVRENIFRHGEMGKKPIDAAIDGTSEVTLAVLATTFTVIAVFAPIAFVSGVVGQFFREFGLTVCFALLISMFDALTIAPMLSAYFAGSHGKPGPKWYEASFGAAIRSFDRFQTSLENKYEALLKVVLKNPLITIGIALFIFISSIYVAGLVPKTFLPPQDNGEFMVSLDLPPGTTIEKMSEVSLKVDQVLAQHKEIESRVLQVGNRDGEANYADIFVYLVPAKQRSINTIKMKDIIREELKAYAEANPKVKDIDMVSGGQRPFNLRITGNDLEALKKVSDQVYEKLKNHPALLDVESSNKPGKPEMQIIVNDKKAQELGISSATLGMELRTRIEGSVPAVYRQNGIEYDIRVRLQDDQRKLSESFSSTLVPNINNSMIRLADVATAVSTQGPATINRQDRARYIQIGADIAPNGPGMGAAIADIHKMFKDEIKLTDDMSYRFVGQAENFAELVVNMAIASGLGILFIYLVLVSLYEGFVTPFTIMLVLPLAICGAFYALFITGASLDIFSMIGCIMLLGIATKNSILLVDYAKQQEALGKDRVTAILESGRTRLRPILMTSVALIAGMLPVAIGLNEASKQRTSMGIAIIGGLISSTLLTLVVIPAAYSYIERFREWSSKKLSRFTTGGGEH